MSPTAQARPRTEQSFGRIGWAFLWLASVALGVFATLYVQPRTDSEAEVEVCPDTSDASDEETAISEPNDESALLADSWIDFAGEQGTNGWHWGFARRLRSSSFITFEEFEQFDGKHWWSDSGGTFDVLNLSGEVQSRTVGPTRLRIGASQVALHNQTDRRTWERPSDVAVLRWVSWWSGTVRVRVTARFVDPDCAEGVRVWLSGQHLYAPSGAMNGGSVEINGNDRAEALLQTAFDVEPGEALDVRVSTTRRYECGAFELRAQVFAVAGAPQVDEDATASE